ncbi:discoidin domain-containing protein [Nostoc sp.]|uniref:discoidin domain-containing protein n=1 Tax=Nostoc sp. TaxID=1180 RepID=UPI002FFA9ADE
MQINEYPAITSISDGDLFMVQTRSDGAYKSIAASDLQAYFGGAKSASNLPSTRTFASSGDANGVFYYLGTALGSTGWNNPSGSLLTITASSIYAGTVDFLTNRSSDQFYTNSYSNSWVEFDLGTLTLKCSYYSLKNRNGNDDHYLRNWQLQGSNDGISWTVLDNQVNNSVINTQSQWLSLPVITNNSYSRFRIFETGANSSGYYFICLGEVELYGILTRTVSP